ncbi:MAG TPA: hypothetical protein VMU36_14530 [Spirochaetia bacterium]|nr:hypothetical protein [Spirochaetia bacterium]
MPPKNPFLLYLRSRLSRSLSIAAGILVVLALAFLRERSVVPILVILLAYAAVTFAVFFSRRGVAEIVKESEEDREAKVRARIARVAQVRERIAVLRLGDERIRKAVEYFLQESGSYLEKCRELTQYSPVANERIERVLEICQVFLGERDEESTGRRYGVPSSADAPGAGTTEGRAEAEGFAHDIMECARIIKEKTVDDLLGVSDAERLTIAKELEEDIR